MDAAGDEEGEQSEMGSRLMAVKGEDENPFLTVEFAKRPTFANMRKPRKRVGFDEQKHSAGYPYIGKEWFDVIEIGHILYRVHLVPDLDHYTQCKLSSSPLTRFYVNKDAYIAMP